MNVSAFAVGANDAANSWATSVGAGTVSLGWAYALGSVMETLGATFVSGYVIQNLGKIAVCFLTNNMIKLFLVEGIINIDLYRIGANDTDAALTPSSPEISMTEVRNISRDLFYQEKILMLGALSSLLSSCFWQISAIYLSLPVSGSHSIVSGLIGNIIVGIIGWACNCEIKDLLWWLMEVTESTGARLESSFLVGSCLHY